MYDLTGRRKRFDLLAQEPEVGDTEAPALPPPLAAKAAALASLEGRLPNSPGAEIASAHAFAIVLIGLAVIYMCALLLARRVRA